MRLLTPGGKGVTLASWMSMLWSSVLVLLVWRLPGRSAGLVLIRPVVDQADSVAASWQGRHDHLRLNTHRIFSHQPGARIPRRFGPFPAATTMWPTCRITPPRCGCGWARGSTGSIGVMAAGS